MMDETICKKVKVSKKKKEKVFSEEELQTLSQEELIDKIRILEAHNAQLQNLLRKKNEGSAETDNAKSSKKIDFDKVSKRHVLLKFYYFGWDSQGYVTQENTNNTIEYFLFKALQKCCLIECREKSNYHRCGRTDKGVSAFCQVISIDLRSKLPEPSEENVNEEYSYCSMLNRLLPDNIRCYSWAHVCSSVSSRFDCTSRTYRYYFPRGDLNVEVMRDAAKFLVGVHDFRNLCKMDVGNGVTEFEREIKFVDIQECFPSKEDKSGYQMYKFEIRGKGFLWHQIRCIMGVLLLVGQGKESPDIIAHLLNTRENPNKPQYSMASHLPLNLFNASYDDTPVTWNVDEDNLSKVLDLLQTQWTDVTVKSTMIREVIQELENLRDKSSTADRQAESLLDGVKARVYTPLLSRVKCESLENKINHYLKKRKLEVVECE